VLKYWRLKVRRENKMKQLEMFPESAHHDAAEYENRKSGAQRWYYVKHVSQNRMRGAGGDGMGLDWYPLNLANPKIMLFANRCLAKREALRCGGKVVKLPEDVVFRKGIF